LSIYALAAKEVFGKEAKSQALYFVEDAEKVDTSRTDTQLGRKKKDLERVIEQMKESDFPAKPGFACGFCEFNKICPHVSK